MPCSRSGSPTMSADRHPRVERGGRVLEDDVDVAAQRPQRAAGQVGDVGAVEADRARRWARAGARRTGQGGLAAAGLADQAEHLARVDAQDDPVDGAHRAEVLDQVLDLETASSTAGRLRAVSSSAALQASVAVGHPHP